MTHPRRPAKRIFGAMAAPLVMVGVLTGFGAAGASASSCQSWTGVPAPSGGSHELQRAPPVGQQQPRGIHFQQLHAPLGEHVQELHQVKAADQGVGQLDERPRQALIHDRCHSGRPARPAALRYRASMTIRWPSGKVRPPPRHQDQSAAGGSPPQPRRRRQRCRPRTRASDGRETSRRAGPEFPFPNAASTGRRDAWRSEGPARGQRVGARLLGIPVLMAAGQAHRSESGAPDRVRVPAG
jgi:hypothetical protein